MKARIIGVGTLFLLLRLAGCGGDSDAPHGDASSGGNGPSGGGGAPSGGTPGESGGRGGAAGSGDIVTDGGEPSAGASGEGGHATSGGALSSGGTVTSGGSGGRASSSGGTPAAGGTPATGGEGSTDGGAPSGGAVNGGAGGGDDESCTKAADCPDSARPICDPVTRTCAPYQCTEGLACAGTQACLRQADAASGGACYTTCTPFALACSGGRECRQLGYDGSLGFCIGRGAGAVGEPCDPLGVVTTGCAGGLDCATEGASATCHRKCNFFAANPGCPTGTLCTINGLCASVAVDSAPIGGACAAATAVGSDCGQDSGAARGLCLTDTQGVGCYQVCRVNSADCGGGSWECRDVFATIREIGVCVDHGTCGDGGAGQYASCDACLTAESESCCSAEATECEGGSPCEILSACLDTCAADDEICIDGCLTANPEGVRPYVRFSRCLVGEAAQGFDGACGGVCQ